MHNLLLYREPMHSLLSFRRYRCCYRQCEFVIEKVFPSTEGEGSRKLNSASLMSVEVLLRESIDLVEVNRSIAPFS